MERFPWLGGMRRPTGTAAKVELPSEGYEERDRWQEEDGHQRTIAFYSWCIQGFTDTKLLDLGSGPGTVALPLSELPHVAEIVCYDADEGALAIIARNAAGPGKISTVRGDTPQQLPFAGGCFDVVVCRAALHHFKDKPGVIHEIARCLKPGGLLLLTEVAFPAHSRDSTHPLYAAREGSFAGYLTYHELIEVVRAGGFEIAAMRPYEYQRGTLDEYLVQSEPAEKRLLTAAWCALDQMTLDELAWSGRRDGPFITYPVLDIAAVRLSPSD